MSKTKFSLRVFSERCKDCGICIEFCPRENLQAREDGSPVMIDYDQCTGCKICEYMCPDFAIQVLKDNEKDS